MRKYLKAWTYLLLIAFCMVSAIGLNYLITNKIPDNEIWRITALDRISSITSVNDMVLFEGWIFGEGDCSCVYAAEKTTGKTIWSTENLVKPYIADFKERYPESSRRPGIVDIVGTDSERDVVYISINYSSLFALDVNDGKVNWGPINILGYISNDSENAELLFVVDEDMSLCALDKSSGQVIWKTASFRDDLDIYFRLLLHDNIVFVTIESDNNARLFSFDVYSGRELWDTDIRSNQFAYIFTEDSLYMIWQGYYDEQTGQISVFDIKKGTKFWTTSFPDYALDPSSPQVVVNQIYVVENKKETDSKLVVRAADNGDVLWEFNQDYSDGEIRYTAYDDVVYVGSETGYLYALDAKTGREIWKVDTQAFPTCMIVMDDSLIVESKHNYVASFSAKTGSQNWKQPISVRSHTSGCFKRGSTVRIHDDRLFVIGSDRRVQSLDLVTGRIAWSWKDYRYPIWRIIPIYKPIPSIGLIEDDVIYINNAGIFSFEIQ
jgi:outer membrane protein assembly factor BamB